MKRLELNSFAISISSYSKRRKPLLGSSLLEYVQYQSGSQVLRRTLSSTVRVGNHRVNTWKVGNLGTLQSIQLHFSFRSNNQQVRLKSNVTSAAVNKAEEADGNTLPDWVKNCTGQDEDRLQGKRANWWWTGVHPREYLKSQTTGDKVVLCQPQPNLDNCSKENLQEYFNNSWLLTEILYSALQGEEAFYRPPYHHLRHPLIFYYGHPATFYTNKLRVAGLVSKGINPYFEEVFEVGVDEMRWDDISTVSKDWPTIGEVNEYRRQVHALVTRVIEEAFKSKDRITIRPSDPLWALMMAIEHEKIHLETSSVLFRELPLRLLRKPEYFVDVHESGRRTSKTKQPLAGLDFPENSFIKVEGEVARIGKREDFPSFGWDNEYGYREVNVPSFQATKYMVSNGEFYEFVCAGGYRDKRYWSENGWKWRTYRNAKWPFFWQQRGPQGSHEYGLRTIFEVIDMPWNWPVIVNYHEASAFCTWKNEQINPNKPNSIRLLTEAEHQLLRNESHRSPLRSSKDDPTMNYSGKDVAEKFGFNLNLAYGSESPVDLHMPNERGFHDVMGNAWEWMEDDFNPLEGFKVHPYYDDFSSPCFDGEHNMILGGSFISCGDAGANLHCRYHFRPHFLQHSGFRYVSPSSPEPDIRGQGIAKHLGAKASLSEKAVSQNTKVSSNSYESEELLNQYLALHFGQQTDNADATVRAHSGRPDHALNFSKRSADLLISLFKTFGTGDGTKSRALDLGCAVGGATFALAEHFNEVLGVDFSQSFIQQAESIRNSKETSLKFRVPIQGDIVRSNIKAALPSFETRARTKFQVGDACNLPDNGLLGGQFDAILAANLLCRLPDPIKCLTQLNRITKLNGVVLFLSPFSWLEEYTPRDKWLQSGDKLSGEALKNIMNSQGFRHVHSQDVPLLIREHERKYQYIISDGSAFVKTKDI